MSILNNIKKGVKSSGGNKGKVLYLKDGSKARIRFLQEVEDGLEIVNHDSFDLGINFFDQETMGKAKLDVEESEDLRHRQAYVWSVWDHDAKEVKLFVGYANNFSPLPQLISMYESYDTILDRDYVIKREGTQTNTRYTVVPMDKARFKNTKAKPYSDKKMMEILNKAFPPPEDEDAEDDDDQDSSEDSDDEEEDGNDYDEMKPRELYMECVERGLKAKKKMKAAYYIEMLEADDLENGDDEEDEDDEW